MGVLFAPCFSSVVLRVRARRYYRVLLPLWVGTFEFNGRMIEHAEWLINRGVLSEKGNGKGRAKSIPKLIRELLMEVVPRGGSHRRLIPRRLQNPEEADYTSHNPAHAFLLSSGHSCLYAFEESNTRLD